VPCSAPRPAIGSGRGSALPKPKKIDPGDEGATVPPEQNAPAPVWRNWLPFQFRHLKDQSVRFTSSAAQMNHATSKIKRMIVGIITSSFREAAIVF